jgi:hypothetical protein
MKSGFEQFVASGGRYKAGNPATKASSRGFGWHPAKPKQGIEIESASSADRRREGSYYEFANLAVSKPGNSVSRL